MKKNLLIAAAVALSAPVASFAGATLELRADYTNKLEHTTELNVKKGGYSRFEIPYARLALSGAVSGDVMVNARLNLKESSATSTGMADGTNTFIEHAYVTKKLTDEVTFALGKLVLGTRGIEGTVLESDMHTRSATFSDAPKYRTGAGLHVDMAGHSLALQVVNNNTLDREEHRANGYGAYWTASLMDKMIVPFVSFYSLPSSVHAATKKENYYWAVGGQVNHGSLSVMLNYLNNTHEDATTVTKDDTYSTFILGANYTIGAWVPEFSAEFTEHELADVKQYKMQSYTLGTTYVPKADEVFRYHVAWVYDKYDYSVARAKDKPDYNTIYAGVRILADVLK